MPGKRLRILNLPIGKLENNSWNVNIMDAATRARLKEEIRSLGFVVPIHVVPLDSGNYRILGGENRVSIATELGYEKIPSVVLGEKRWSELDLQKFFSFRLNFLHGKIEPTRMAQLYDEMAAKYGKEEVKKLFAFTDENAWKQMLTSIRRGLKQAGMSKETVDKFDEETKTSKSVNELAAILNTLFAKYGDTLDNNFMVFTHGKKKHLYVRCSKDSWKAVKKLSDMCGDKKLDINEFLTKALAAALEDVKQAEPKVDDEEAVF